MSVILSTAGLLYADSQLQEAGRNANKPKGGLHHLVAGELLLVNSYLSHFAVVSD